MNSHATELDAVKHELNSLMEEHKQENQQDPKSPRLHVLTTMVLALLKEQSSLKGDEQFYTGVSLYLPNLGEYRWMFFDSLSHAELRDLASNLSFDKLIPVDRSPTRVITVNSCPDFLMIQSVESIELRDYLRLAVYQDKAQARSEIHNITDIDTQPVVHIQEEKKPKTQRELDYEATAAAWALEQIKHESGAHMSPIKVSSMSGSWEAEFPGSAMSDASVILAHCTDILTYQDVWNFWMKLTHLRILMGLRMPGTDMLQGKQVRPVMMADCWTPDEDEQAFIRQEMMKEGIEAALRDEEGGYELGWSRYPPKPDDAECAARYKQEWNKIRLQQIARDKEARRHAASRDVCTQAVPACGRVQMRRLPQLQQRFKCTHAARVPARLFKLT